VNLDALALHLLAVGAHLAALAKPVLWRRILLLWQCVWEPWQHIFVLRQLIWVP
jgi:hypothetical protein